MKLEEQYWDSNKILRMNINIFEFELTYLNLNKNLLRSIRIFKFE